jgi:hypothetical protein
MDWLLLWSRKKKKKKHSAASMHPGWVHFKKHI